MLNIILIKFCKALNEKRTYLCKIKDDIENTFIDNNDFIMFYSLFFFTMDCVLPGKQMLCNMKTIDPFSHNILLSIN